MKTGYDEAFEHYIGKERPEVQQACVDPVVKEAFYRAWNGSIRDPLTGAYNRNFFNGELDIRIQEEERAIKGYLGKGDSRKPLGLCVAVYDLEDFKKINDKYGHLEGDRVLRMVNDVMDIVYRRPNDVIARPGGDEFHVLHSGSEEFARGRAKTARRELRAFMTGNDLEQPILINWGVAAWTPDMTVADLIKEADSRMYQNKKVNKAAGSIAVSPVSNVSNV